MENELLMIEEVVQLFRVSCFKVYQFVCDGDLVFICVGCCILIL